jgi:protocatechuate 3,4-dioxygenase, alpha subunit
MFKMMNSQSKTHKPALLQTPSQTAGPYFAYGLTPEQYLFDFKSITDNQLSKNTDENTFKISGKIYDGNDEVIPDAMIELWDAESNLFGRFGTGTENENRYVFHAQKPKSIDGQAPYFSVILFMRGQLIHSYTRIYFSDEEVLNSQDETLLLIPAERRDTVIAHKIGANYEFNIYMQGEKETVFFEI